MKAKILDVSQAIWRDLIRDSDWNGVENETKNTIAPASKGKRSLFVPRSAIDEQGAHKRGRMSDGACEPNFDPKISGFLEIDE